MSTNFYWVNPEQLPEDAKFDYAHIGKRCAAGYYCWDCQQPLIKGGWANKHKIHYSGNEPVERCENCGKPRFSTGGGVALELGIKDRLEPNQKGVTYVSSFDWKQEPEFVLSVCRNHLNEKVVKDYYEETYTGQEFLDMLRNNCPIQFVDSVGREGWD